MVDEDCIQRFGIFDAIRFPAFECLWKYWEPKTLLGCSKINRWFWRLTIKQDYLWSTINPNYWLFAVPTCDPSLVVSPVLQVRVMFIYSRLIIFWIVGSLPFGDVTDGCYFPGGCTGIISRPSLECCPSYNSHGDATLVNNYCPITMINHQPLPTIVIQPSTPHGHPRISHIHGL